jgi:hypothetical protein
MGRVSICAPQPQHDRRMAGRVDLEANREGGRGDGVAELDGVEVDPRRGVRSGGPVEPHDGVDVDQAPGLELGHLRVGHPRAVTGEVAT